MMFILRRVFIIFYLYYKEMGIFKIILIWLYM